MSAIRHHTTPEFYLKKFKDPALPGYRVWQYEKGIKPRSIAAVHATVIDHYNTVQNPITGALDSDLIENVLSKHESKASALFRRIESKEFGAPEKIKFAKWMSVQMSRVPCFREMILNQVRRDYQIEVGGEYALAHLEDDYFDTIADWEWGFIQAPAGANFVTSDNPVYICNAGVVYPLNPKLLLVAGELEAGGLTELTEADSDLVDIINLKTIESAFKFVFAAENRPELDLKVQECIRKTNMDMW